MVNKKGNLLLGLVIGIFIFFAGMLALPYLKEVNQDARTDLNCSLPSVITNGNMLTCLENDAVIPLFILGFISVAGGFISHSIT